MKTQSQSVQQEEFLKKYAASQQRVFAFVVSLSPGWADADDIFQSVSLVLWRKWTQYDPQRPFLEWAMGIARIEIRKQMALKGRSERMLSEEAISAIELGFEPTRKAIDPRLDALHDCLEQLPKKQRSLVRDCYSGTDNIRAVAASRGLSCDAIYGRLKRIREMLHQCVDRSVAVEEGICNG